MLSGSWSRTPTPTDLTLPARAVCLYWVLPIKLDYKGQKKKEDVGDISLCKKPFLGTLSLS